jgi:hypothetical protein
MSRNRKKLGHIKASGKLSSVQSAGLPNKYQARPNRTPQETRLVPITSTTKGVVPIVRYIAGGSTTAATPMPTDHQNNLHIGPSIAAGFERIMLTLDIS